MITRYRPTDRINLLNKWMEDVLGESSDIRSGWMPAVDIKETATEIAFFLEAPGLRLEDIDVELVGEMLTIRGKREMANEERREDFVRIERSYGEFQRSFTVGVPVKSNDITASYKDGVLTVRVPKADEVQPRKVIVSNN